MKKNLLKLLTLVLALVMVVTVFAGCKKADEETDAPTQGSEETPTETQEQPADEYKPSAAQLLNGKEWGKDYTELYDEIGDKVTIDDVQEDPTTGLAYVEYEGKTYELGMDFLSMAMVYKTAVPENSQYETEDDVYAAWWKYYMTRWNYLLPEIPLYSNEYYDVYNAQIKGVDEHPTNPYWGPAKALIDWTSEKTDKDIIIGNSTDLSGKFRYSNFGGSNPGASDLDVDNLINGMETVATTKEGGFEVNKTVVKQLDKVENEDGTLTYTITLNDGLLFSDGTPVTAKNYLYYTMVFSTLVASEAEGKDRQAGLTIVGFEEFNAYDGTNEGDGVSKTFTGLRLLAVNQFESLSVGIDNDASHKIVFAAICPKRLRNISQKLLHLFLFPDILSLIIRNSIELLKCRIERQICKLDLVILVHISGPHSIFMYIAKYIIEEYSGQALAFESTDKPPENLHNSNSTLKTSSIGISLRSVIWIIPATASIRLTSPVTVW